MGRPRQPWLARRRTQRTIQGLVALVVAVVPFVVAIPSAFAGVGFGVSPSLPANVTVGLTYPGFLLLANTSSPPDDTANAVLNTINFVPSCGTTGETSTGDCPPGFEDPGVFQLGPTATGEAGTACALKTFSVTSVDPATGQVSFVPLGGPVILTPPGTGNTSLCRIDFTFFVVKEPTKNAGAVGVNSVQTAQLGFVAGTVTTVDVNGQVRTVPGFGGGANLTAVTKGTLPITTQVAPTTTALGGTFHDTATLTPVAGAAPPTGTVLFNVYGPGDTTCAGPVLFTSTNPLNAAGTTAVSNNFLPTALGTYRVIATYSGDINYIAATSLCSDPAEAVVVNKGSVGIATQVAPSAITLGGTFHDTATLSPPAGEPAPTGTVLFNVYGPGDTTCAGPVLFTSTNPLNAAGTTAVSDTFTPMTAGTYRVVATYSGDGNYNPTASLCSDPAEAVVVSKTTLTIATQVAPTAINLGGSFHDTATLSAPPAGAAVPTGTVLFNVYGPGDTTCVGPVLFTSTNPLNAAGTTAVSNNFTPANTGTYRVVATYSGDANYNGATSLCADPAEAVVVNKGTVAIATQVLPASIALGSSFHDTATLTAPAGGAAPTGTVLFNVYGPGDTTCAGPVLFTSTNPVNAAGTTAVSGDFTPGTVGTYRVVATYSGDTNYNGASSLCSDPSEAVVVSKATITIATQVAPAAINLGGSFHDTATLGAPPAGAPVPTGTVLFNVYGPGDTTCAGPVLFTSTSAVNAAGTTAVSGNFTPGTVGTYRVVATYSGDTNYNAASSLCSDPAEAVVVGKGTITIATQVAPAAINLGSSFHDTATLGAPPAGAPVPTGTVLFNVYGPADTTCAGPVLFTSTNPVNAAGTTAVSGNFTPLTVGTYRVVATYSGDTNYNGATSLCSDPAEAVVVSKATITIATQVAPAAINLGASFQDTATLGAPPAGAPVPTGTVLFNVYGPADTTCAGAVLFTSTNPVNAAGTTAVSGNFTPTAIGTYRVVATYSGDTNYNGATSLCSDPAEAVVVTKATITIATQVAPAAITLGASFQDTATLGAPPAGAPVPTGTVLFNVYGPADTTCAGPVLFTSTNPVNAAGTTAVSGNFTPAAPGTYRVVATYSGDTNYNGATSVCSDPAEAVVVAKAPLPIATQVAPAAITLGSPFHDTATLTPPAGGPPPTGSVTFNVFGPGDTTCAGPVLFTSISGLNAAGTTAVSGNFTPAAPGTYRVVASYSGDSNYNPSASLCSDPAEAVVVAKAPVQLSTLVAPASITVGATFHDTATLTSPAGAPVPTGTVMFNVYGPGDTTCAGPVLFTSTNPLNAAGTTAVSDNFMPATVGTYRVVATYSGDTNYNSVVSLCADPAEAVVVTKAPIAIVTQASPPVVVGGTISDTANLSGGTGPTGTITFNVFGPGNAICAGVPVFTSTVPVAGNGNYSSGPFTPTAPGTYRFVASYSGDVNNNPAGPTACSDLAEAVVVMPGNPAIVTHISAPGGVPVGGTLTDTATLSGGVNPTGTITFQVFGPDNNTCAGIPAFTSTKTVNAGDGNYTSDPFTVPAPGAYRFVATYSGDANNSPAGPTACQDANEVSTGSKVTPQIATTASADVMVNGAINDTAVLTGGFNPQGTITFNLFGPNSANCAEVPVFTATVPVNGSGNYNSPPFTPTAPGSYTFVASYSGDTNNNPAGPTVCNDPTETVQVLPVATNLSTLASPSTDVGQPIFDTATLGGSGHPTGTITFQLFGPDNALCAGAAVFTSVKPVNGTGTYTSAQFIPTAPGTYEFVATYSGDANNAPAGPTPCDDPAESVVVLPRPQIAVTKVANPLTRPEPGGNFTFTVTVSNPSTVDPVKITSLFDNIYGDLATRPGSTCGSLIGVTLAPGATSPPCSFTGPFNGVGGQSQTDTVTVTGIDTQGIIVSATAQATVTLTTLLPSISVTKAASPLTRPEPGGLFTFTVQVTNPNTLDPITITSLVDNIYGDLATRAGSTCGTLIGTTLAPGQSSPPCTFTGPFNGVGGQSQTDTVTVTGIDSNGHTATATAQATVSLTKLTPVIAVTKAASPLSRPEPGGTFTFTVQVSNPSAVDPIKITSLTDNIYGDLATRPGSTCGTLIGIILPPGGVSPACTFTGPFTGVGGASQTDTVTVSGVDSFGNTATATAQATVTLTTVTPEIKVTKAADPASLPAPGGTFTFTVQVSNPSTVDPVKITSLVDNIYGDLATRAGSTCGTLIGLTLAPGATSPSCSFTGPFNGVSGDSQTDIVTVIGVDTLGHTVTATAQATVTLTPADVPQISVTKAAQPPSRPAPGGDFTFTVTVHNPSTTVPVKITSLVDNIYGDLATRAGSTCGTLIGVTLDPGATSAPCSFTGPFTGVGGASQTDIVTVTGVGPRGQTVTATAHATVTLTTVTPVIAVTKSATPLTLPQPGGTFTFTVRVSNPSTTDPITITSIVDNIYGDLAVRAGSTCGALIGVTLAPGAVSAPCSFTGGFNGAGGASQTDIVTVTGKDSQGNTATNNARATVGITAPPPGPPLALTGLNNRRPVALAGVLILGGALFVLVGWRRRRYD